MNNKKGVSYGLILLPILFSSANALGQAYAGNALEEEPCLNCTANVEASVQVNSTTVTQQAQALSESDSGFIDDASETQSVNLNYVGGKTRVGVGFDTELKGRLEGNHIFLENESSATSGEGWLGVNPKADDNEETITGAGVKVNHHWVQKDESGQSVHVNKVFGAYDQNAAKDKKISVGYGQERENNFWSGHVSKGLSDERLSNDTTSTGKHIYEKAYDYGVGGRFGTFLDDQLMRVQGGVDYEWGADYAGSEDKPAQITVSGGVEKFFADSPHSVGANIEVLQKQGGYVGDEQETDVRGNVNYRYEFGGDGVFQSAEKYRRVRVEIPGKTVVKKQAPKVQRKLVKHTMELESDTFFEKGQHVLTPAAQQRLKSVVARIRDTGYEGNIRITGNTCDLGSTQLNQSLSERRAGAVRHFMASQGFEQTTLMARGLGEAQPKYPNTDATRHKNRRVDIEYVTYENEYKDEVVQQGGEVVETISEPRVVWRKELIPTPPTWVGQALHNTIQHKETIDTYRTVMQDDTDINNPPDDNHTPNAQNDPNIVTTVGAAITIAVLANDTDADGDELTIVSFDEHSTQGGTITRDGIRLVYTPASTFTGVDTFTYTVSDGQGGTATATVTIKVSAEEEPNRGPAVAPIKHAMYVGETWTLDPLASASDPDGDTLSLTAFDELSAQGGHIAQVNGQLVYTPKEGFTGTDGFTFTIADGRGGEARATVTVHVQEIEQPAPTLAPDNDEYNLSAANVNGEGIVGLPILEGDTYTGAVSIRITSQPTRGTIENGGVNGAITGSEVLYKPSNLTTGQDKFTYVLVDASGRVSNPATVIINWQGDSTPPNPPAGELVLSNDGSKGAIDGDIYTFEPEDTTPRTLTVLGNDVGEGMEIIAVSKPSPDRGFAKISADGKSIIYTLRSGHCESHQFTYTVRDSHGNQATATVYIYMVAI